MGAVYFTADLHLEHEGIGRFRKHIRDSQENSEWVREQWSQKVKKRDLVWVLGDAAFQQEGIDLLASLPGTKRLLRGNHDQLKTAAYLEAFQDVFGILKYKGLWLSHAPIHPQELYRGKSVHGHVHYNAIPDERYLNVCCDHLWESTGGMFMKLEEVVSWRDEKKAA